MPDPKAPKNLASLMGNIVKFVHDHSQGRIPTQRRRPVEELAPRKVCPVCVKPFDFITVKIKAERTAESAVCDECKEKLEAGYIACIEGTRYAFIRPMNNKCSDLKGQILKVDKVTMDEIEKQGNKIKQREDGNPIKSDE